MLSRGIRRDDDCVRFSACAAEVDHQDLQLRTGVPPFDDSGMAALTMPEMDDGPLRDLLVELHRLHARAGLPSTRKIAVAVGM